MEVKPFKAYRFDSRVVGDVGRCIAPPYDVISEEDREELYRRSEHNIVRIIRGKTTPSDNGRAISTAVQASIFRSGSPKGPCGRTTRTPCTATFRPTN